MSAKVIGHHKTVYELKVSNGRANCQWMHSLIVCFIFKQNMRYEANVDNNQSLALSEPSVLSCVCFSVVLHWFWLAGGCSMGL